MNIRQTLGVSFQITALGLLSSVATAQVLEEIIVTAQKRESGLQSTPISITGITGDMLAAEGVSNLQDLAGFVPGLVIGGNSGFEYPISIRGISAASAGIGADSPAAVYVDGVYMGRPNAGMFQLVDIQRIEVMRGPQGTLYGRNSVAGAIAIYSKDPSEEQEVYASGTYTDLEEYQLEGSLSGPISENVGYRVSASYRDVDNWASNSDGRNVMGQDAGTVRGTLRFTPTDRLDLRLRADYNKVADPFVSKALNITNDPAVSNYDTFTSNENSFMHRDFWGTSLEMDYSFDGANLTSITAYREHELVSQFDSDGTLDRLLFSGQGKGERENQTQFSQELRLASEGDNTLDWIVGAYYFEENTDYVLNLEIFSTAVNIGRFSTNKTTSYAVFGQLDWHLSESITATAGLRYSDEKKEFQFAQQAMPFDPVTAGSRLESFKRTVPYEDLSDSWNDFTPKLGLSWQFSEDLMFYASVTKGFKSGGFNILRADEAFDPETVISYELGFKTTWFDQAMRFNSSVFYADYSDLQVRIPGEPGVIFIQNASDAEIYGGEFELQAFPTENLFISATLSLLHTEYKDFVQNGPSIDSPATCPGGIYIPASMSCDLSGNALNRAPDYTLGVSAEYEYVLGNGSTLTPRLAYQYEDSMWFTEQNVSPYGTDGWEKLDFRLTYAATNGVSVALFGTNLTDDRYYPHVLPIGANAIATGVNFPRTYGLEISYRD